MSDCAAGWESADDWKVDGLLDQTVQSVADWMEKSADSWMLESLNRLKLESSTGSVSRIAIGLESADVRVAGGAQAKSVAVGREESLAGWENSADGEQRPADGEQSLAG